MSSAITKTQLENGLTVLLKEMHHAPMATFMIWYRVGSRNEISGRTGISHWVEHMMFKGTPTFPGATMERMISREGDTGMPPPGWITLTITKPCPPTGLISPCGLRQTEWSIPS